MGLALSLLQMVPSRPSDASCCVGQETAVFSSPWPGYQAVECWLQTLALLNILRSLGGPAWGLGFRVWGLSLSP